jgi:hypothetical protein
MTLSTLLVLAIFLVSPSRALAFTTPLGQKSLRQSFTCLSAHSSSPSPRRSFLASSTTLTLLISTQGLFAPAANADDFESIAARAAAVSAQIVSEENSAAEAAQQDEERKSALRRQLSEDTRSIYDFELPVNGKDRSVSDLVGKAKVVLVVNIKQDDPLARKNIPELIALADR